MRRKIHIISLASRQGWDAVDLGIARKGKVSKSGSARVQKVFLTLLGSGSKGLPRVFCTTQTLFAPLQPHFAPVQEASCSRCPKDLLHPLLTTFGNFHFSGNFPGPQLPNVRARQTGISQSQSLSDLFGTKLKTFISCYRTPGPQKDSLKGSLKGFGRVLEGF